MSVSDVANAFALVRDLSNGMTILRQFDATGTEVYEGIAATWNADPTLPIWWIIKFTQSAASPELGIKDQYSPPNQVWNNRATIFP